MIEIRQCACMKCQNLCQTMLQSTRVNCDTAERMCRMLWRCGRHCWARRSPQRCLWGTAWAGPLPPGPPADRSAFGPSVVTRRLWPVACSAAILSEQQSANTAECTALRAACSGMQACAVRVLHVLLPWFELTWHGRGDSAHGSIGTL